FLVLAMLIAILLIFISQKSPVNYLLNQCFLTSQVTCLQDIITANSTNILFAAKLNNYLGYSSLTYLQFGSNSINVTLTGIGKNGTNTFYGDCYPMNTLVPYAGQTFCIVKIPKQLVPRQGQKISATYQISYNICTSGEKCVSSHSYSQSGYTYLSFGGDFAEFVALSAGMPTPQNPIIGIGQSVTLHEDAYGGITPYTFAWFSGQSSNCTKDSPYAGNVSQITVSPSSSTYYCYSVSDNYNQHAISPADFVQVVPPPAPLPNEVFTYGTQHTLTATAQLSSDTIEILINNKVVASGTGTASYTICSTMTLQTCLANATYSVKAYEVQTDEYSSASTLTIQKAAPQLSLTAPSNFQYTGSGGTINYAISTLGNQALATLYVNGGDVGSTYTSASYTTSATVGTYNINLQTNGNQNYTAASKSAGFTISPSFLFSGTIYFNSTYSSSWVMVPPPSSIWTSPFIGCISCSSGYYAPPTGGPYSAPPIYYNPLSGISGSASGFNYVSGSGTALNFYYTYSNCTTDYWGYSSCTNYANSAGNINLGNVYTSGSAANFSSVSGSGTTLNFGTDVINLIGAFASGSVSGGPFSSVSGSGTALNFYGSYICTSWGYVYNPYQEWGGFYTYECNGGYYPFAGTINLSPGPTFEGGFVPNPLYLLTQTIDLKGSGKSINEVQNNYGYNFQDNLFMGYGNSSSTIASITYHRSSNYFSGGMTFYFSDPYAWNWCNWENLDQASGDYIGPPQYVQLTTSGDTIYGTASGQDFHVYWHGNYGGHSSSCSQIQWSVGQITYNPSSKTFSGQIQIEENQNYYIYLVGSGNNIYAVANGKYIGAVIVN
ncbi:MAG: hypothetical protein M1331_03410, partial [Candidatus Marsarchaeota archaeon]|nr:hypothetical protein [Candidatus Marsarchaeota archaeon]